MYRIVYYFSKVPENKYASVENAVEVYCLNRSDAWDTWFYLKKTHMHVELLDKHGNRLKPELGQHNM